jgi:hypothetical protein
MVFYFHFDVGGFGDPLPSKIAQKKLRVEFQWRAIRGLPFSFTYGTYLPTAGMSCWAVLVSPQLGTMTISLERYIEDYWAKLFSFALYSSDCGKDYYYVLYH